MNIRQELKSLVKELKSVQIGIIKKAYSNNDNSDIDTVIDKVPATDLEQLLLMVRNTLFMNTLD